MRRRWRIWQAVTPDGKGHPGDVSDLLVCVSFGRIPEPRAYPERMMGKDSDSQEQMEYCGSIFVTERRNT